MSLTKHDYLSRSVTPQESVEVVPGFSVWFRVMSARERSELVDRYRSSAAKQTAADDLEFRLRLIIATACTASGEAIFTDDDRVELCDRPAAEIDAMTDLALRVNGLGGGQEKNSESSQNAASPSA